jgi:hypothetical protein
MSNDPRRPAANLELAFTSGRRFQRDEWCYQMQVDRIADLVLPSGRIVAADPGNLDGHIESPFAQQVPPGAYPVDIAVRRAGKPGEEMKLSDTACMRVQFQNAPVSEWILATTPDQNPDDLAPFEIFGYGVDVGMGSFADRQGLLEIQRAYTSQGKKLYDEFYFEQVLPAYEATQGRVADILLDSASGANLVVCSSGCGDGFYASYWGLASDGSPVCLVTDFGLLTNHVHVDRDLGSLGELAGKTLSLSLPGGPLTLGVRLARDKLFLERTGKGTAELQVQHQGERLYGTGSTHSHDDSGVKIEMRFADEVPREARLVVHYLDRLEPL